jgi:hypothetical protein
MQRHGHLLLIHFSIAQTAREALDAPGLLQRLEHLAAAHFTAFEADVSEQLKTSCSSNNQYIPSINCTRESIFHKFT